MKAAAQVQAADALCPLEGGQPVGARRRSRALHSTAAEMIYKINANVYASVRVRVRVCMWMCACGHVCKRA